MPTFSASNQLDDVKIQYMKMFYRWILRWYREAI